MTMLKVSITFGELKAEFEGEPGDVYTQVVRFLEKTIPTYSLARRIQVTVGVEEILEKLADKLAHSPGEGIFVRASLSSLPASTAILLFAAAKHLSHLLGYAPSPEFGGSELSSVLGKPEKTVSGRLSELVQKGFLKRVGRGGYAITSLGLTSLAESSGAG